MKPAEYTHSTDYSKAGTFTREELEAAERPDIVRAAWLRAMYPGTRFATSPEEELAAAIDPEGKS